MRFSASLVILSAASLATAHGRNSNLRHKAYLERRDRILGRQASTTLGATSKAASSAPVATSSAPAATSSAAPVAAPANSAPAATGAVSGSATASSASLAPAVTTPTVPGTVIPPLNQITANAPIETPLSMFTTFTAGATPPLSGAPPLPTIATINPANYPALDVVPPIDSPQVRQWLSEIDLSNVPNLSQTVDGSCASDPVIAANTSRCWWTCGGCTRPTDITACPTKLDWGVSYDDGPSPYTPKLVNFLHDKNITSTFYVVGSRVISRPEMLQTEYMLGHEISDHTWSHPPLTTLSNEQIVAELGWTRQVIKDVIGVTPKYMRPPYGDIDDRVRAVVAAMGLTPVIWSGSGNDEFDTDDWKIAGGTANGTSSLAAWDMIISTAVSLTTGFIVLQHDLYQQSVDMAVGYILPSALTHNPPFSLMSVIECLLKSPSGSYVELSGNSTVAVAPNGTVINTGSSTGNNTTTGKSSAVGRGFVGGSLLLGLVGAAAGMLIL